MFGMFVKQVSEYFVKRGIPQPTFFHEWADGSGAQNKCATAFADVVESGRPTRWVRGLGIPCQRNFFETSHARGEQDAMGVAVKHEASLAVMSTTDKWYQWQDSNRERLVRVLHG